MRYVFLIEHFTGLPGESDQEVRIAVQAHGSPIAALDAARSIVKGCAMGMGAEWTTGPAALASWFGQTPSSWNRVTITALPLASE